MQIPDKPPDLEGLLARSAPRPSAEPATGGRYLHWDELRRRPAPRGLSHEDWWLGLKLRRVASSRPVGLIGTDGAPFTFVLTDEVLRLVHGVDREAGGRLEVPEVVTNPETRDRYLVSSLHEEAITSSQLEGAATTRLVAKEMLRTGREPRDRDERMIANNYRAMELIREHAREPLRPDFVRELHAILTDGTLAGDGAGRLRRPDEDVRVHDERGDVLHVPPPARELEARLEKLCRFANSDGATGPFVPPVVRAILVHFWLAYDHPFVDGNGRTARALFYWSMLNQGYWLTAFITISRLLRRAPAAYARAFLFAETDGNDSTYFVLHQLDTIRRALLELFAHLKDKVEEVRDVERSIKAEGAFNRRQLALLAHALRHPGASYTIIGHKTSHGIVHQTARTDLFGLSERGLLAVRRVGKTYEFEPAKDLDRLLKRAR